MAWIIILVVIGAIILWVIFAYNSLVRLRVQVNNAWSQIDVQLKRRHDLIPNLVNAVKGYLKYERETLEKVVQARYKAMTTAPIAERAKAEGELSALLGRLMAIIEQYPELKGNEEVARLMEELTATENRIAFARQHYNDMVEKYNTAIQVFPKNIIASLFNFKRRDFFEMPEAEKAVPKVDISI